MSVYSFCLRYLSIIQEVYRGWELLDAAFGSPPDDLKENFRSYPSVTAKTIVLVYASNHWDLLIQKATKGKEYW